MRKKVFFVLLAVLVFLGGFSPTSINAQITNPWEPGQNCTWMAKGAANQWCSMFCGGHHGGCGSWYMSGGGAYCNHGLFEMWIDFSCKDGVTIYDILIPVPECICPH